MIILDGKPGHGEGGQRDQEHAAKDEDESPGPEAVENGGAQGNTKQGPGQSGVSKNDCGSSGLLTVVVAPCWVGSVGTK